LANSSLFISSSVCIFNEHQFNLPNYQQRVNKLPTTYQSKTSTFFDDRQKTTMLTLV